MNAPTRLRSLAALSLAGAILLAACGSSSPASLGSDAAAEDDSPDPGGGPPASVRPLLDRGGGHTTTSTQAIALADSMFDFDPTLDPKQSAEANAAAIEQYVKASISCPTSVTRAGTMVSVSFGAAPGCTLKTGATVSGSVAVAVNKNAASLVVVLTFTSVVVDGKDLAGSLTFTTTNGSTFSVSGALTSAGETATFKALTVTGASGSFTLDGVVELVEADGAKTTLTFKGVKYTLGKCYPGGGTLTVTKGAVNMVATFTSATADTGQFTVTQGKRSYSSTLPAYGKCPVTGDAGTRG